MGLTLETRLLSSLRKLPTKANKRGHEATSGGGSGIRPLSWGHLEFQPLTLKTLEAVLGFQSTEGAWPCPGVGPQA